MNADCSVRQHNPRAESVEQHPDNRSGERPHHRAEQDRAGSQPAAPAKLFDDGDEKDRKCVARAKGQWPRRSDTPTGFFIRWG
jgi:hypothetical protein